jgi:hypothetical protein
MNSLLKKMLKTPQKYEPFPRDSEKLDEGVDEKPGIFLCGLILSPADFWRRRVHTGHTFTPCVRSSVALA